MSLQRLLSHSPFTVGDTQISNATSGRLDAKVKWWILLYKDCSGRCLQPDQVSIGEPEEACTEYASCITATGMPTFRNQFSTWLLSGDHAWTSSPAIWEELLFTWTTCSSVVPMQGNISRTYTPCYNAYRTKAYTAVWRSVALPSCQWSTWVIHCHRIVSLKRDTSSLALPKYHSLQTFLLYIHS